MKLVLNNQKGVASFEAVFMMILFLVLTTFGVGCFGIVHTGILNNIAARTYAWETFNHRANVSIFRDNRTPVEIADMTGGKMGTYVNYQIRLHTIASEDNNGDNKYRATERALAMGRPMDLASTRSTGVHALLKSTGPVGPARERVGVNPVWIKTQYGICIDFRCGGINL